MTYFVILMFIIAVSAYAFWKYQQDLIVMVPTGSVGWDGEELYPAGTYQTPYQVQIINIEDRITTFGVDVLGTVSIIDTDTNESGWDSSSGETPTGPVSSNRNFGKNISQST
ncbi:MAG TPA: hypothetical protein VHL58_06270, partial [Thermoanaerobaculia bacterium]|nr:hypothetical protein [Thermoanaerobaculia bacterium]